MDNLLKEAVASLFCYVIKNEKKDIEKERPIFCRFMKQNFGMECDESNILFDNVIEKDFNIDMQISIISNALRTQTYQKMSILKQLNSIIIRDNLKDDDYDIFEKTKKAFFR
jgi:hypothetical protein